MIARLFSILSRLSLASLHRIGWAAGWITYGASPTYRRRLRANLVQAFGEPLPHGLLGAAVAGAGRQVFELPWVWLRPRDQVMARVAAVSGWQHVESAWQAGRGILFLTPHLGCFEIAAQYYAARRPITVLYRPPKRRGLQVLVEHARAGGGAIELAPADMAGVRRLIRALRAHEAADILPDQVPARGEGAWLPFFGRPAYTMTLAARLSAMAGCVTILAWAERLDHGRGYHLHLSLPQSPLEGDTEQRAAAINRELEGLIRCCPEQYLWGYNRYKRPAGAPPAEQETQ